MCGPKDLCNGNRQCIHHRSLPLKGLLRIAILCLIKRKTTYGGEIHEDLRRSLRIDAPKPLIYILLRRMEREGWVMSTWDVQGSGPAKRRYRLTDEGEEYLTDSVGRLKKTVATIESIISLYEKEGGDKDG